MRSDLLDRTVLTITHRAQWFLLTEELPTRDGFLQAVTPSVKILGVFVLIGLTVTQNDVQVVATLLALALALAVISRIPVQTFLGRLAGPPVIAAFIVAPQAILMDGPRLTTVPLSVTGLDYVATFSLRVAACVGFLSLLLLTTRFSALLTGFNNLWVPSIVLLLLAITYRYLLVFFTELERMVRARQSRTLTTRTLGRTWRDSGNFLGTFLLRSLERGEDVGRAAQARGGTGKIPYRPPIRFDLADAIFGLIVAGATLTVMIA
jgi:cobalt/nickel transport system permease protein